ncbi:MAG: acyl-CoA thioesterase, partial [Cytophagales bacterium]|nr:acyl-CoA thioesterase [Cytophaga sp.]
IVWHGHYVSYFEDAREAFGTKYGINYLDINSHGYVTPIVKLNCEYKRSLHYGDVAIVKATYIDSEAAKLIFRYEIHRKSDGDLIASGDTVQVMLDPNGDMSLVLPDFILEWKQRVGLT